LLRRTREIICFFFIPTKKRKVIKKVRSVCEKDREVESTVEESKKEDLKNSVYETETDRRIEKALQMTM
jgi:hypothetical protein